MLDATRLDDDVLEELVSRVEAVGDADIERVIARVFDAAPRSLAVVGPMARTVQDIALFMASIAGPDALSLWSPVETRGENLTTVAEFEVCPSRC